MSGPWQPPAPSLAALPVDPTKTEPKPAYYKLQFGDDITGFSYYVRTLSVTIGRSTERSLPSRPQDLSALPFGSESLYSPFADLEIESPFSNAIIPPAVESPAVGASNGVDSTFEPGADLSLFQPESGLAGNDEIPTNSAAIAAAVPDHDIVMAGIAPSITGNDIPEASLEEDIKTGIPGLDAEVVSAQDVVESGAENVNQSVEQPSGEQPYANGEPNVKTEVGEPTAHPPFEELSAPAEDGSTLAPGADDLDIKPDLSSLEGFEGIDLQALSEAANAPVTIPTTTDVPLSASGTPVPPPPPPPKPSSAVDHVDVDLGNLKSVSRNHATIEYRSDLGQFCLEILGRNGAWVDDRYYVKGTIVPLNQGSQIQIATRIFSFILPPSPESSPAAPQTQLNEPAEVTYPYDSLPYPYNLPPEQVGFAEFYGEPGPGPASAATIAARVPAFNAFAMSDGYGLGADAGFGNSDWLDDWESQQGSDEEELSEESSEDSDSDLDSDSEDDDDDLRATSRRPVARARARRVIAHEEDDSESELSSLSSEPDDEPSPPPRTTKKSVAAQITSVPPISIKRGGGKKYSAVLDFEAEVLKSEVHDDPPPSRPVIRGGKGGKNPVKAAMPISIRIAGKGCKSPALARSPPHHGAKSPALVKGLGGKSPALVKGGHPQVASKSAKKRKMVAQYTPTPDDAMDVDQDAKEYSESEEETVPVVATPQTPAVGKKTTADAKVKTEPGEEETAEEKKEKREKKQKKDSKKKQREKARLAKEKAAREEAAAAAAAAAEAAAMEAEATASAPAPEVPVNLAAATTAPPAPLTLAEAATPTPMPTQLSGDVSTSTQGDASNAPTSLASATTPPTLASLAVAAAPQAAVPGAPAVPIAPPPQPSLPAPPGQEESASVQAAQPTSQPQPTVTGTPSILPPAQPSAGQPIAVVQPPQPGTPATTTAVGAPGAPATLGAAPAGTASATKPAPGPLPIPAHVSGTVAPPPTPTVPSAQAPSMSAADVIAAAIAATAPPGPSAAGQPGVALPSTVAPQPGMAYLPPGQPVQPYAAPGQAGVSVPGQPGMYAPQPGQPVYQPGQPVRPPHPGAPGPHPGMQARPPYPPGAYPGVRPPYHPHSAVRPATLPYSRMHGRAPLNPQDGPPKPYYISELKENPTRPGHILCSVPIPPSGAGPRPPPQQMLGLDGKPFIGPPPLKPTATFATIIHRALTHLPRGRGTLGEVCNWVAGEWEWFRLNPEAGWQNSIRHNLSLNKAFLKVPRIPEDDPESKGSVWIIDPEEGPLFEEKQRRDALKSEGKAKNAEEKRMKERLKAEERARKQREREAQMAEAAKHQPQYGYAHYGRPGMPVRPGMPRPMGAATTASGGMQQSANRGVLQPKAKIVVVVQPITPALRAKTIIDKTDVQGNPLPFVCDGTTLVLEREMFGHLTQDIIDKLQQLGAAGAVDVLSAWVVNKKQQAAKAALAKSAGVKPGVGQPGVATVRPGVATVRPGVAQPGKPGVATPVRPGAPGAVRPGAPGKLPGPAPPGASLTKVISMIAEVANARGDVNTVGPNAGALLRYIRHVGVDIDLPLAKRIWATGVVPPLPPKKIGPNGKPLPPDVKPVVRPGPSVRPAAPGTAVRPGAPGTATGSVTPAGSGAGSTVPGPMAAATATPVGVARPGPPGVAVRPGVPTAPGAPGVAVRPGGSGVPVRPGAPGVGVRPTAPPGQPGVVVRPGVPVSAVAPPPPAAAPTAASATLVTTAPAPPAAAPAGQPAGGSVPSGAPVPQTTAAPQTQPIAQPPATATVTAATPSVRPAPATPAAASGTPSAAPSVPPTTAQVAAVATPTPATPVVQQPASSTPAPAPASISAPTPAQPVAPPAIPRTVPSAIPATPAIAAPSAQAPALPATAVRPAPVSVPPTAPTAATAPPPLASVTATAPAITAGPPPTHVSEAAPSLKRKLDDGLAVPVLQAMPTPPQPHAAAATASAPEAKKPRLETSGA